MPDDRMQLGEWVSAQIQQARSSAPRLIADAGNAFQVWGTIGSVGYLTIHGDAILDRDVGPEPGSFERFTGGAAFRTVLFFGSRRHPDLLRWLPTRSPGDPTCSGCDGFGRLPFDTRPMCEVCQGYGWIPEPATEPSG